MKDGRLVTLTVDGETLEAAAGEMLLPVLRRAGRRIPTLCHDDRLTPYGGCRLCVVARRDGREGLVPACSTPVLRGMVIDTDTREVREARRGQLHLLTLDHRMDCPVCERHGDCRLQDLLYEYGLPDRRYPFQRRRRHRDDRSPVIARDPEKCILCGKCVRLCEEVQGVAAIGMVGRGLEIHVATAGERPLDCELCGQCVNACPVSALTARPYSPEVPVWLREKDSTTCSYCSCGCQVVLESFRGSLQRVSAEVSRRPNHGKLCVKGWLGWDVGASAERLTGPLLRRHDRLEPVSWKEALDTVAAALRIARSEGPPVVGVGSSRLSCEDAYVMQRFLRAAVGTPHVDVGPVGGVDALVEGMGAVTGAPRSTATLEEMAEAGLVLVLRGDPTRTHPLVKTELVQGVRQRGQQLVLAHALSGGLERHAAMHLLVEPASEPVLLHGLAARLLARQSELLRTLPGFAGWSASVKAYTPEVVESTTGIPPRRLHELADRLLGARRVVLVVVTGLGIPGDEAETTRAAATLMALLETEGARGGGVLVLGEKCNVQGVLDAGLHPNLLPGHRRADRPEARRAVEARWATLLPGADGWGADRSFREAAEGGVGVLYLAGQDPAITWPRGYQAKEAVGRAGFVVVQDTFLTQTARLADAVLPVRILGERSGSLVGADGVRRPLRPVLDPPAPLPSDRELFIELARRLGSNLPPEERMIEELDALVDFRPRGGGSRCFEPVPPPLRRPAWSGILLDASPQLFHSGSVTNRSAALEALSPSEAVRIAPADAARLGVGNGQMVRVSSGPREVLLRVRLDRTVRPGTIVSLWNRGGRSAAALMVEHGQPTAVEVRRSG